MRRAVVISPEHPAGMGGLPPIEAIEAFCAVAAAGSVRGAARALELDPSAVSRRVRQLEHRLGRALLERRPGGVVLTQAGLAYRNIAEPALEQLRRGGAAAGEASRGLRVAASHSLAAAWLAARIGEGERATGAEIELIATRDPELLRAGSVDLAIWGGMGRLAGLEARTLATVEASPLIGPGLGDDAPLLTAEAGEAAWSEWIAHHGSGVKPPRCRSVPTLLTTFEAAAAGLGYALASPFVAESFLRSGRLRPVGAPAQIPVDYRLYRRPGPMSAEVRRFTGWITREMAQADAGYRQLLRSYPAARGDWPRPAWIAA